MVYVSGEETICKCKEALKVEGNPYCQHCGGLIEDVLEEEESI